MRDVDPRLGVGFRQALRERAQAELADRVQRIRCRAAKRGRCAREDDRASLLLDHARHHGLGGRKRAGDLDIEDRTKLVVFDLQRRFVT